MRWVCFATSNSKQLFAAARKTDISQGENGKEERRNYGITIMVGLVFYRMKGSILMARNTWRQAQKPQIFKAPVSASQPHFSLLPRAQLHSPGELIAKEKTICHMM